VFHRKNLIKDFYNWRNLNNFAFAIKAAKVVCSQRKLKLGLLSCRRMEREFLMSFLRVKSFNNKKVKRD
jgi:hypothetical protein